jgi:hypothetical protein
MRRDHPDTAVAPYDAVTMPESVTGLFELHCFVAPLDPDEATIARFRAACQGAAPPMKALLLALDYVGRGFVAVLQSSRYVEGDAPTARAAAARDAALLRAAGLEVIREKVEAVATDAGVPRTTEDATRSPAERYFEFHLLVDRAEGGLTDADMRTLRGVASDFATRLETLAPLSYNVLKPSQRFLNLRARGVGRDAAMASVDVLGAAIAADGALTVKKVIAEYVCFDSNRAVDNGWLEPADVDPA